MEYERLAGASGYTPVAGMETLEPKGVMLGQYIKEFQVDLSKVASDRMVSFNILFEKPGSNRDYLVTRNVSLRNDILTNKEVTEIDEEFGVEVQPAADKIEVTPKAPVYLWPGETQQYRVILTCSTGGVPNQSKTWNLLPVVGTLHTDTKMNSADLLTISTEEESTEFELDVYGEDAEGNALRPNGGKLKVYVRQIKALNITRNDFEDASFPITQGGTYKIKVQMEGENLPPSLVEAGKIKAEATVGKDYVTISEPVIDNMTAEFTIQIKDTAPDNAEIGFIFKVEERPEFSHIVKTTNIYNVSGSNEAVLTVSSASSTNLNRLDVAKTKVDFESSSFKSTVCKNDGTLKEGYSIRYTYSIVDSGYIPCSTVTSTIGATAATVVDPNYITSVQHASAFEADAVISDKVFLQSGQVRVSAELIHNTSGTPVVVGTSNVVTYTIKEATMSLKRTATGSLQSDLKYYVTPGNNTASVYFIFKEEEGFAKGANYKVSLDQVACDNTIGSVNSGLSNISQNMITVYVDKNADFKSSKSVIFTYGGLKNKIELVLKEANVEGTDYYVPTNKGEMTFVKNTGSGKKDIYAYYIDDTHRMEVQFKSGTNTIESATYYYYENMKEKSSTYTYKNGAWKLP